VACIARAACDRWVPRALPVRYLTYLHCFSCGGASQCENSARGTVFDRSLAGVEPEPEVTIPSPHPTRSTQMPRCNFCGGAHPYYDCDGGELSPTTRAELGARPREAHTRCVLYMAYLTEERKRARNVGVFAWALAPRGTSGLSDRLPGVRRDITSGAHLQTVSERASERLPARYTRFECSDF